MRKINPHSLLPALLCGAALLAFGCDRGEERHAGQVETPAPTQIARTPTPAPAPAPPPGETPAPPPDRPLAPAAPRAGPAAPDQRAPDAPADGAGAATDPARF